MLSLALLAVASPQALRAAPPAVGSGSVLLHLKADAANVTLGPGNTVTGWNDLSGLNNHFSQPDANRQPVWVDNVINGQPAIRFDGNSDFLQTGTGMNAADRMPFTFFAVTYNTEDPFSLFDSAPQVQNPFRFGAFGAGFATPRFAVEMWDRNPGVPLGLHADGSVISITGSRNGANNRVLDVHEISKYNVDSANSSGIGNANPVPFGGNGNPKIGTINNGSGGFYYTGDVAEMIIYNGALSPEDRSAVENYLRDQYALQFTPPAPVTPSGLGNYGSTVLASSPLAYWRLETNDSPPTDSANVPGFPQAGAQNGVYQNISPYNLGQPGPRPSDSIGGLPLVGFSPNNHAVHFQGNRDGGNDVALFADDGTLNMSVGGAFTLEAWVKGSPTQEDGAAIFAKGFGGGNEQFAVDVVGGAYRFFAWNGQVPNTPTVLQTQARPNNEWQQIVAVMDIAEGVMQVYLNGDLVGSVAPPATIVDNLHDLSVGAREQSAVSGYTHNFDGLIDEVAVYAYPLSAAQIRGHYDAAFVPEPSSVCLMVVAGVALIGVRRARRR